LKKIMNSLLQRADQGTISLGSGYVRSGAPQVRSAHQSKDLMCCGVLSVFVIVWVRGRRTQKAVGFISDRRVISLGYATVKPRSAEGSLQAPQCRLKLVFCARQLAPGSAPEGSCDSATSEIQMVIFHAQIGWAADSRKSPRKFLMRAIFSVRQEIDRDLNGLAVG
jgi:hypothetical protein